MKPITEDDITDAGPGFAQRVTATRLKNSPQTPAKPRTRAARPTTPPTYRTAVVAHTSRSQWATTLALDTDAHVCIDNGRLGCTKNHLEAWKHHANNPDTEWALVIEDDALPIPEFAAQTAAALAAAPSPLVSLYLGQQRPPQHQTAIGAALADAAAHDHAWILAPRAYHAVAVAIRTDHVKPFLRIATLGHNSSLDIDEILSEWARYDGLAVAYTVPSLVDHRDEGTIARHRDCAPRPAGRKAWKLGGRDDWATPATVIP